MKFLLIATAVLAVAVATPAQRRLDVPSIEAVMVPEPVVDGDMGIVVEPTLVDESVVSEPANVGPSSSPLVQIIVNVQAGSPVIEQGKPRPEPIPDPSIIPEIETDPVIVVPMPEIETDPVIVVPMPETPAIVPEPAINIPEILN